MGRKYFVALATSTSAHSIFKGGPQSTNKKQQKPGPLIRNSIHCHYRLDDPQLAGSLLSAAVQCGAYTDALGYIQGIGLASLTEQIHTGIQSKLLQGDMWALVIYDGRDYGPRNLPYVFFGDHRHDPTLSRAIPKIVNLDHISESTAGGPGFMLHEAAKLHGPTLFVQSALVADLQL